VERLDSAVLLDPRETEVSPDLRVPLDKTEITALQATPVETE